MLKDKKIIIGTLGGRGCDAGLEKRHVKKADDTNGSSVITRKGMYKSVNPIILI